MFAGPDAACRSRRPDRKSVFLRAINTAGEGPAPTSFSASIWIPRALAQARSRAVIRAAFSLGGQRLGCGVRFCEDRGQILQLQQVDRRAERRSVYPLFSAAPHYSLHAYSLRFFQSGAPVLAGYKGAVWAGLPVPLTGVRPTLKAIRNPAVLQRTAGHRAGLIAKAAAAAVAAEAHDTQPAAHFLSGNRS